MYHKITDKKAFVKYFQIGNNDCAISLTAELFAKIRVLNEALKNKVVTYKMLQINKAYYKSFKLSIIEYTINCAKDIKIQIKNHSDSQCLKIDLDYNQIDFLDGVIHSGIENGILNWHELGFRGKDHFNFLIEKAKNHALKLTYHDLKTAIPESEKFLSEFDSELPGFEMNDVEEDEDVLSRPKQFNFYIEDGLLERQTVVELRIPVPDPGYLNEDFFEKIEPTLEDEQQDQLIKNEFKHSSHEFKKFVF